MSTIDNFHLLLLTIVLSFITAVGNELLNRNLQHLRYQPQIAQAVPVSTLTALDLAYLRLAEADYFSEPLL